MVAGQRMVVRQVSYLLACLPSSGHKKEIRETYPWKLGIHPDEPIGTEVMGFDDKMERCSSIDLSKRWYCHTHPYTVQLTGAQIMACFDRDRDPEVDHMETMWQLVRKEEEKLFAGLPECFRVIPDFRLGNELKEAKRSSDLDFDYITTMITEHTGVRIEADKKIMLLLKYMDSWAVYAIDIVKKMCLVMDPVETEEPRHEMEAKHKRNAIRVLSNLRRCIHECIPGVWILSVGWGLDFNTGMHTCCEREES